jgi:hypothetical protein
MGKRQSRSSRVFLILRDQREHPSHLRQGESGDGYSVGGVVPVDLECVADLEGFEVAVDDVGKHAYAGGIVDVDDGNYVGKRT